MSKFVKVVLITIAMLAAGAVSAQTADAAAPKFHIFTNVSGTGTAGRIVKWTDTAGTLADSVITETGSGLVGVGSPATISNKVHVYTSGNADGVAIDGPLNPALVLRNNGPVAGFLGVSTAATAFFSNAEAGDIDLRSEAGNILIGRGGLPAAVAVVGSSVGLGTTTPGSGYSSATQNVPLHIYDAVDKNTIFLVQNTATGTYAAAVASLRADTANMNLISHASTRTLSRFGFTLGGWNEILAVAGNGVVIGTLNSTPLVLGTNNASRVTIDTSGNVTIGAAGGNINTTINGTLTATKVIGAVYQDVAEWVPATTHMEPGTVVVLNRQRRNEVMPSARSYDTAVAGVVSANPGVVLGVASDSKAQIATTGRVKVHVDATAGGIAIGDLLVTSNKPGMAMKSQPVDLGGVQFHRPGTVIGKALEPLPNGEGEILVLLSLQ